MKWKKVAAWLPVLTIATSGVVHPMPYSYAQEAEEIVVVQMAETQAPEEQKSAGEESAEQSGGQMGSAPAEEQPGGTDGGEQTSGAEGAGATQEAESGSSAGGGSETPGAAQELPAEQAEVGEGGETAAETDKTGKPDASDTAQRAAEDALTDGGKKAEDVTPASVETKEAIEETESAAEVKEMDTPETTEAEEAASGITYTYLATNGGEVSSTREMLVSSGEEEGVPAPAGASAAAKDGWHFVGWMKLEGEQLTQLAGPLGEMTAAEAALWEAYRSDSLEIIENAQEAVSGATDRLRESARDLLNAESIAALEEGAEPAEVDAEDGVSEAAVSVLITREETLAPAPDGEDSVYLAVFARNAVVTYLASEGGAVSLNRERFNSRSDEAPVGVSAEAEKDYHFFGWLKLNEAEVAQLQAELDAVDAAELAAGSEPAAEDTAEDTTETDIAGDGDAESEAEAVEPSAVELSVQSLEQAMRDALDTRSLVAIIREIERVERLGDAAAEIDAGETPAEEADAAGMSETADADIGVDGAETDGAETEVDGEDAQTVENPADDPMILLAFKERIVSRDVQFIPTEAADGDVYIAFFAPDLLYRITYLVDGEGAVSLEEETVNPNEEGAAPVGAVAEPAEGYFFVGWYDAKGERISEYFEFTPNMEDLRLQTEITMDEEFFYTVVYEPMGELE